MKWSHASIGTGIQTICFHFVGLLLVEKTFDEKQKDNELLTLYGVSCDNGWNVHFIVKHGWIQKDNDVDKMETGKVQDMDNVIMM